MKQLTLVVKPFCAEAVLRVIVRRHGLLVAVSESSSFQILARVRTRTPPATG